MQQQRFTRTSGSFGATDTARWRSSTASAYMPRCMFASALPVCNSTEPVLESSPSTGGNCVLRSQYVRYASSGSPVASFTAAEARRKDAESSLLPDISWRIFSATVTWLQARQKKTQSACISRVGWAFVSCTASVHEPSIAREIAESIAELMSWVSFARATRRSFADAFCCSFFDFMMTAMSAAALCPAQSEFCMTFRRSKSGIERQQRASVAPSSLWAISFEGVVVSQSVRAFWKFPT
mmetsp:Transcript_33685/g.107015  ORF Transcript_33685/g.107015 Transcript_33685/m.107015 type:complete len:239 (+) Transcript_33685:229-945(+)